MATAFLPFDKHLFSFPPVLCIANTIIMETTILFGLSILMSLIAWNKISNKYLWSRVKEMDLKKAVQPVLFLNSFRFAGLSFFIPGIVHEGLNPAWAIPAAFGDFTAAILALITLSLVNTKLFRPFLWIFNIWGLLDLIVAFVDGPRYGIIPFLGPAYYIVILYVPLLLLTHVMIFRLLGRNRATQLDHTLSN
jgi:hypothetical protein